ncbi:MAG: HAD-IC family P-type ATPase, partial [Clostridia bacterium]|nr:HAD-IC family P-type ATPase [Clostridia bacterium]
NFAMKISAGAKYFKKPTSEIWRSLMLIVKVMAAVIVPLDVALFCVKYFAQKGDLNATVATTIGSLVGMIPSGLAALSSAVFCISVIRLSRHNTLAQDMYCVETLARVDVLCLDKTGTITSGDMEVNGVRPRKDLNEEDFKKLLKNVIAASSDGNATALAIRSYLEAVEVTEQAEATVPFSSIRKWSGAYIGGRSYVLGAPEFILDVTKGDVKATCDEMAEKGYRVLALASSRYKFVETELPKQLRLEGYIFITDKIRPEAPETMRFFREQGVTVKIISGDNPVTVRAVALRAGVTDCDNIIDMSTVGPDRDMREIAEKYTVFGRVLPDQKLALVKALKENKHTVAMTGDGVNDVLALKESDCSIAMASGSDAAKNVSSLVLLDSNFASLPKVVAEGRRSINNLERSASLFLVKTIYNFLLALIFLVVPTSLPFETNQLTLIGMVTIGIPSFVLALEPNSERVTGRFLPKVLSSALPGALMVVAGIVTVLLTKQFFLPELTPVQVQSMYVFVTVFVGFVYLFKVCMPFNWVHAVLFLGCVAIYTLCYFVEFPFFSFKSFFGLSTDMTDNMVKALVVIGCLLLPWSVILLRLTERLHERIEKFMDERIMNRRKGISKMIAEKIGKQ